MMILGLRVINKLLLILIIIILISISQIVSLEKFIKKRSLAIASDDPQWDYGIIPYKINYTGFDRNTRITLVKAMRYWERYACIQFIELDANPHPSYVLFTYKEKMCQSPIGRYQNGCLEIKLCNTCKFRGIVHELGHIIGLIHEHQRPDRDKYIRVNEKNIQPGYEHNFVTRNNNNSRTFGLPYDVNSLMHYTKYEFAVNESQSILTPLNKMASESLDVGEATKPSKIDIETVNRLYNCPECRKILQSSHGIIESPLVSKDLFTSKDFQCEWRITVAHGHRIELKITSLDIYLNVNCSNDYLEITDGYWVKSPLLGRYCGNESEPLHLFSTGNRMLVRYRKYGYDLHKGFDAHYQSVCNHTMYINDELVSLESPNYPEPYGLDVKCTWHLVTKKNYQILMTLNYFKLERSKNCVYDSLQVRDGDNNSSPLIGSYCGEMDPWEITSTDNNLYVTFVSDSFEQDNGFSASLITKPSINSIPD
ncbi:tolloid-like protein 1 [Microplitis mediator]|uniref:tolloid-like protein 1 n=1 Tax=Microplitis mediator TaxID=375433 RepID=UPI0025524B2C|nr:tolloid-like protein 1 [Microplitis mediator]